MTTSTRRKSIFSPETVRITLALVGVSLAIVSMIANVVGWARGGPLGVRTLVSSVGIALLCLSLIPTRQRRLSYLLFGLSLVCLALVSFVLRT